MPTGGRTGRGRAGNRAPVPIGIQRQGRERERTGPAGGRRSKQLGLPVADTKHLREVPSLPLGLHAHPSLAGPGCLSPAQAQRPGQNLRGGSGLQAWTLASCQECSAEPPPGLPLMTLPAPPPKGLACHLSSIYLVVQRVRPVWHHLPPTCPKYRPWLSAFPLTLSRSVRRFPHWGTLVTWLSI